MQHFVCIFVGKAVVKVETYIISYSDFDNSDLETGKSLQMKSHW